LSPLIAALAGLVAGHVLRRATPLLAGVKSDGMPFRWPWLEIVGAVAFAVVAWRAALPPWFLLTALLVAITGTDFHVKLIPNRITYPGTVLGLAASAIWPAGITGALDQGALVGSGLALGLLGAAAGFLLLELFRRGVGAVVGMEVLGMGDSKLLLMVGAFLGPVVVLLSIVPALLCGIVLGIPYTRIAKTPHLPFGPALALGGYLTMLFGAWIRDAWLGLGASARELSPKATGGLALLLLAIAVGLLLRVRRRRAEYTRMIEEDYERLEERD
jgi:leader peptidase (prepilin peptidase)/N-methyltransferase